jgi:hypothetical protein
MSPQNLQVLRPSRKSLKPGDVFTMQLPSLGYLFGRVISTTAMWSGIPDGGTTNLVYVFKHQSPSKTMPDRSHLQSDQLLIPPQLINRLGRSRGYFETLGNLPLGPGEVLPVHCFEDRGDHGQPSRWFNEHAEELPEPIPPVGIWAGGNYRTVEDKMCKALGIPLAPDKAGNQDPSRNVRICRRW